MDISERKRTTEAACDENEERFPGIGGSLRANSMDADADGVVDRGFSVVERLQPDSV